MESVPRRVYLLAGVVLFFCLLAFAVDAAQGHYTGPLFDAMAQIDHKVEMKRAVAQIKNAGVKKVALFARSLKRLGQNESMLIELRRRNPGLILLGAPKYFLLDKDLDSRYINATLKGVEQYGYAFVGEICYTHGDKTVGKDTRAGERYVDPMAPGTGRLISGLKPFGIPLMTHWEVYAWDRDWPRFDALYARYPGQVFLIPHMAFGTPEQVSVILSRHPNVVMTLSKRNRAAQHFSDRSKAQVLGGSILDQNGRLTKAWRAVLLRYQDRLLFATDVHIKRRWRNYGKHARAFRVILGQLPGPAAKKIAFENAERLYRVQIDAADTRSR